MIYINLLNHFCVCIVLCGSSIYCLMYINCLNEDFACIVLCSSSIYCLSTQYKAEVYTKKLNSWQLRIFQLWYNVTQLSFLI